MQPQRRAIFEVLQGDEMLLSLLASNAPFWDLDQKPDREFSIVPADKVRQGMEAPFVSVRISVDSLVGENLTDAFVYIRCYNTTDKTFVRIDEVLSRVKHLLHRNRFQQFQDGNVNIDTVYESTGAELQDEAFAMNFRESQYKTSYL